MYLLQHFQSLSQVRDLSRERTFGRPGHGAPNPNEQIRKRLFTEHQMDSTRRRMDSGGGGPNYPSLRSYNAYPSPTPYSLSKSTNDLSAAYGTDHSVGYGYDERSPQQVSDEVSRILSTVHKKYRFFLTCTRAPNLCIYENKCVLIEHAIKVCTSSSLLGSGSTKSIRCYT